MSVHLELGCVSSEYSLMLMESTTQRFSFVRIGLVSFYHYVPMVADQLAKRASDQGSQYDNGPLSGSQF